MRNCLTGQSWSFQRILLRLTFLSSPGRHVLGRVLPWACIKACRALADETQPSSAPPPGRCPSGSSARSTTTPIRKRQVLPRVGRLQATGAFLIFDKIFAEPTITDVIMQTRTATQYHKFSPIMENSRKASSRIDPGLRHC